MGAIQHSIVLNSIQNCLKLFEICHADIKKSIFRTFFSSSKIRMSMTRTRLEHSWRILDTRSKLLDSFCENSKKSKIFDFSVSCKNLCFDQTFSQTHRQTQRMHSWIGLDLRKVQKLVRSQTNTRILSYDHFSDDFAQKILRHSSRHLALSRNYSKSSEGSTSHTWSAR